MIFEEKIPVQYRTAFLEKVVEISEKLGVNPNWLMAIMNWESAGTFSASVKNPYSGATGLIQFMPATARDLGTTVEALASMSEIQQLDWVYKYYVRYKSKLKSYTDLYLTTFYPVAVGKPSDYVLGNSEFWIQKIAEQNPAFDLNKDRKITKGEIEEFMLNKIPSEWFDVFKKKALKHCPHCCLPLY
jgi:hypothetical protein